MYSKTTPLKIIISAYACMPDMGSEPGVGWNMVKELANHHEICVLTRKSNRIAIESELNKQPIRNLQFIYIDPPILVRWLPSAQVPHYYFWQLAAYFSARKILANKHFDLIHHVTYVRYSTPSFLSLLPLPFIWGPVGGGEQAPRAFWPDFNIRGKVYEVIRYLAHRLGEFDPFTGITAKRSILVRATTADTAKRLSNLGASNIEIFPESGLSKSEIKQLTQLPSPQNSPLRFITMARLLHWKGIHLGLKAFAQFSDQYSSDTEYWILGEGPEEKFLKNLASRLNIADKVKFHGRLSREQCLQKLGQCHVLVHPSLHDSGGWVCLEAMAAGRPVVCLNLGGPSVQVTDETGIRITANTPEQVIVDLSTAFYKLAKSKELRIQLGDAGKLRIQKYFSWETKCLQLAHLYQTSITRQ